MGRLDTVVFISLQLIIACQSNDGELVKFFCVGYS